MSMTSILELSVLTIFLAHTFSDPATITARAIASIATSPQIAVVAGPSGTNTFEETFTAFNFNEYQSHCGEYGAVDDCGVYTVTTEEIYCNTEDQFLGNLARIFDVSEAQKAIEDYCTMQQPEWDPAKEPRFNQFNQAAQSDYTYTAHASENPSWIIRASVHVWDPPPINGNCVVPGKFVIQGDDCRRRLTNISNKCK